MMRGYWDFPGGEPFERMHDVGGVGILGTVLMIILWVAVIAALVIGIRALIIHSHGNKARSAVTPLPPAAGPYPPGVAVGATVAAPSVLAILEERYARGEIDREEFLQRKADLGFAQPGPTPPETTT